jgi:hypothetical protein
LSAGNAGNRRWPVELLFAFGGDVFACGAGENPLKYLKWALRTPRVGEIGFASCWDIDDGLRLKHVAYVDGVGDSAELWVPVDALEIYAPRLSMFVDLCVMEAMTMSLPHVSFGMSRMTEVLGRLRAMGDVFDVGLDECPPPWRKEARSIGRPKDG